MKALALFSLVALWAVCGSSQASVGAWTNLAAAPASISGGGSVVYPGTGDFLFVSQGDDTNNIYTYSISLNQWGEVLSPSGTIGVGGGLVYPGTGNFIYAIMGDDTTGPTDNVYKYDTVGRTWSAVTSPSATIGPGSAFSGAEGKIFLIPGNDTTDFLVYDTNLTSWTSLTPLSGPAGPGTSIVYPGGDFVYVQLGDGSTVHRFDVVMNSWDTVSAAPTGGPGRSMAYPGKGEYAFVAGGSGGTSFFSIPLSDSTIVHDTLTSLNYSAASGSGMAWGGDEYIYTTAGNGTTNFLAYEVFTLGAHPPTTPSPTTPMDGATGLTSNVNLALSAFSGDGTHAASHFQLANDRLFSDVVSDSTDALAATDTYMFTGVSLLPSSTYYWRARYMDNTSKWSNWSKISSFTTDSTVPTGPTVIADDGDGISVSTTISASWDAALDPESTVVGYSVSVGTGPGLSDIDFIETQVGTNYYSDSLSLTDGQIIYVTVQAQNGMGMTGSALTTDGITIDTTPSNPVSTMYDDGVSSGSFTNLSFSWEAAVDPDSTILSYIVSAGTTPGASDVAASQSVTANTFAHDFTALTLTNGQSYYGNVVAVNISGLESNITSTDGILVEDTTAPGEVAAIQDGAGATDLSLQADAASITVSFSAATDPESSVTDYIASVGTTAGASDIVASASIGLSYSYTFSGLTLTPGQYYYASVAAINGQGLTGSAVSTDGVRISESNAPSGGSITYSDGVYTAMSISITLDPGTDDVGLSSSYELERAMASYDGTTCGTMGGFSKLATVLSGTPTYEDTALTNNSCYQYTFLVTDVFDNLVTYSSSAIAILAIPDTTPPGGGSISYTDGTISSSTVALTLSAGTDDISLSSSMVISRATAAFSESLSLCETLGSYNPLATVASTATSYSDTTLADLTCYGYQLTVTDSSGNEVIYTSSAVVAVDLPDVLGPSGGSISYSDGQVASSSVLITVDSGTDPSGLATSADMNRAEAPLSGNTCGTFGNYSPFVNLATSTTSYLDTSIQPNTCYKYQWVVSDLAGNTTTYSSTSVLQVVSGVVSGSGLGITFSTINFGNVTPGTTSLEGTIGLTTTSSLASVRLQTALLTRSGGTGSIASTMIIMDPTSVAVSGAGSTAALTVMVPYGTPVGTYSGVQTLFADSNSNGTLDGGESTVQFTIELSVPDFSTFGLTCPAEAGANP